MDASVAGLLAAAVGVGGTLGSAWLTQRRSDAARREEWERLERTRVTELSASRAEAALEARRVAYTAYNTAARHYLACLRDHSQTLGSGAAGDPVASLEALDTSRTELRRQYAEAQLTVPDPVLEEIRRVNRHLGALYGTLIRLTRGVPREGDDLTAAQAAVREGWELLRRMRHAMRTDLGVTERGGSGVLGGGG